MQSKSLSWKIAIAAASVLCSTSTFAQKHWGYEGEEGPSNWAKLDPKFVMCGLGKNQSPIDITGFVEADLKPLKFTYSAGAQEIAIVNNGHTIQVNYAPGSSVTVDGREFELKQFHFHSPSENKIDGKQYPLEAHLVHADKDGNLAVVALMFEEGAPSAALTRLWEKMPANSGDKNPLPAGMSVVQLLPAQRDYYRYDGSLTTPPCSEGVRWLVLKRVATASKAQIDLFATTVGHPNNRPLNPVNARTVLK